MNGQFNRDITSAIGDPLTGEGDRGDGEMGRMREMGEIRKT